MTAQASVMTQNDKEVLENQIFNIRDDVADIKSSLSRVADALTKLAVLEERHQTISATTNKILSRIEKMEERQIGMDKREFAVDLVVSKVEQYEVRLKSLEEAKSVQEGQIKGSATTIKILWTVIAGSGAFALLNGIF